MRTTVSLACAALALAACTDPSPVLVARDAALPDVARTDVSAPDATTPAGRCTRTGPRALPPTFAGPSAPIEIYRDDQGIPHLYAQNDLDLFYASGYAQATDRLFQMDLMRRSAAGTLAEVLGPDKLAQDQIIRRMDLPRLGRESADLHRREHPESYRLADAWTAGVNARIRELTTRGTPFPPGFRASEFNYAPTLWSVDDTFAVGRLLLFENSNQLQFDILATIFRQYLPSAAALPITQPLTGAFIVPLEERPAGAGAMASRQTVHRVPPRDLSARLARFRRDTHALHTGASNNWGVAGRHSANGRPMLAGDPHQSFDSPGVFWAQHMNSADAGGSFDVIGFAFVGAPGVHLGHNRRVGWTATSAYPDMMDLWEVAEANGTVTLGTRNLPIERCVERIAVRGMPDTMLTVEDVPGAGVLLPSSLAPVPITSGDNRILFNWTGFRPTHEADVFFALDRADSAAAFDAAVRRMETGAFNFVFADARQLQYRSRMLLPDRGAPRAFTTWPNALLDGTDPSTVWTGALLSDDQQPHSSGGVRGFVTSANNDPFGFTSNGQIADDPYYYGVWFDPGTRAARIEQELTRLTARGSITVEDFQALQQDTHDVLADTVLPLLFEAAARVDADPALAPFRNDARLTALLDALRSWDRTMTRESGAPVIFEGFQHFLARGVLSDDLSILFDEVIASSPVTMLKLSAQVVARRFSTADRYMQEGRDVLLLRALAATRDWLATRFGSANPAGLHWRDYHRTIIRPIFNPPGPFAVEPLSTAGSIGTVNVSQGPFFSGATPRRFHDSTGGAVYRMVISFNADGTPAAVANFVRGNSGDPTSPYWADREPDWLAGTYRSLPFARPDVMAAMREHTTVR